MERTPLSTEHSERLMRRAGVAAVAVALVLIVIKLVAWEMTNSVSLLASLIDSFLDVLASGLNLIAIRYALIPPDDDHRWGHGKAEAVSGLAQAAFIGGSSLFLFLQAGRHLIEGTPPIELDVGLWVMGVSLLLTLALVLYQRHVLRQADSLAIEADSLHYVTDILTNLAVILALGLASLGWSIADPILAILIGLYILRAALLIGRKSFHHLMDQELPDDEREQILAVALKDSRVLGVHGLKTRRSGPRYVIQMHLELDGALSLIEAHRIADQVETNIRDAYPGADIITHQDPAPRRD